MRPRFSFSSRKTRTIDPHNQHRKPFPSLAREVIRISDLVLYVLDVRFIEETRNLNFEKMMQQKGKKILTILNKSDLIDLKTFEYKKISELKPFVFLSCKDYRGIKKLKDRIMIEIKRMRGQNVIEEDDPDTLMGHKRVVGRTSWLKITSKAHVGVVGYPNTGKSSVIKALTNRNAAKSSSQAGFTKGIQKIRFSKDILILDTPGVIEEKSTHHDSPEEVQKHTKIGAKTAESVRNPEIVLTKLYQENHKKLESYYKIESNGDLEEFTEILGRKKNFLSKGNIVDRNRVAKLIIKDWQEGKIK